MMKKIFVLMLFVATFVNESIHAQNVSIKLGRIARNQDGTVKEMNYVDAVNYCKSLGKFLPTAKQYAIALNPQGIRNVPTEGFKAINLEAEPNFYYAHNNPYFDNYVRPSGDLGNNYFWTATGYSMTGLLGEGWIFSGVTGGLALNPRQYIHAVRCATN